jgi:hypothetical protein
MEQTFVEPTSCGSEKPSRCEESRRFLGEEKKRF